MNSSDYAVDRSVARTLATNSRSVPATQNFEAHVRDYARRHLARRPGYFVLTGLDHLSEAQARRFVHRVSTMLGNPLAQDIRGDAIRDVIDRGAHLETRSTVRYSDTRQGGNLHTDGCHRLGHVPDIFTLYCVRQASSGGALVLVHVSDLLDTLGGQPEMLDALLLPVHFDTRDDQTPGVPRTVQRPILDTVDGAARIHYLREYIDSAYRRREVPPLSAQQASALNVLDTLLDRADLQARRRLRPGEMIVVNNRSVIHGRTAFSAEIGPGGRLLLRSWIAVAPGIFGESEPGPPPSDVSDGDSQRSPL